MATAQTIINRALRHINALAIGENPTDDLAQAALADLNLILDSWSNEEWMQSGLTTITQALTAGDESYTIGSGGDISTTWPVDIKTMFVRDTNNNDYVVKEIDAQDYARISLKTTTTSYPDYFYYNRAYPLGTIKFYPAPIAGLTLHMDVWSQITQFTALTTTVTLPAGYERALSYNLALELTPQYGKNVNPVISSEAVKSKNAIKNVNQVVPKRRTNIPIGRNRGWNIFGLGDNV